MAKRKILAMLLIVSICANMSVVSAQAEAEGTNDASVVDATIIPEGSADSQTPTSVTIDVTNNEDGTTVTVTSQTAQVTDGEVQKDSEGNPILTSTEVREDGTKVEAYQSTTTTEYPTGNDSDSDGNPVDVNRTVVEEVSTTTTTLPDSNANGVDAKGNPTASTTTNVTETWNNTTTDTTILTPAESQQTEGQENTEGAAGEGDTAAEPEIVVSQDTVTTEKKVEEELKKVTDEDGSANTTSTATQDAQGRLVEEYGSEQGESKTTLTDTTKTTVNQVSTTVVVTEGTPTTDEGTLTTDGESESDGTPVNNTTPVDVDLSGEDTEVSVTLKPGDTNKAGTTAVTNEADYLTLPTKPTDVPVTDNTDGSGYSYVTTETEEDGTIVETTTRVTYVKDTAGNIIGYEEVATTKTTAPKVDGEPVVGEPVQVGSSVVNPEGSEAASDVTTEPVIKLPEKPENVDSTVDGIRTVVTVEEIVDPDDKTTVIGYLTTTTKYDMSGETPFLLSEESKSEFGTVQTTQTIINPETTVTNSTQTITTTSTQQITTGVTTSGVVVNATDRTLTGTMSEVREGDDHGTENMSPSIVPTVDEPKVGKTDTSTDLYHREDNTGYSFNVDSKFLYQWIGEYGLESAIRVADADNPDNTWQAHQFILKDEKGTAYYVYCADFEVSPQGGYGYSMENLEDAEYYTDESAKHIRAIATQGYWGTSSGVGSLAQVKASLKAAGQSKTGLTDDQIDSLTDGEALTATQAAIWTFGNSGLDEDGNVYMKPDGKTTDKMNPADIVGMYNTNGTNSLYSNDVVQKLYTYFIGLTAEPTTGNTLLTTNSITEATITVGDKVVNPHKDSTPEDATDVVDYYETEVSFKLEVVPSATNDDLLVKIVDDAGNVYTTKRIAGTNEVGENYETIAAEGSTYTIKDVVLPNGVTVTLNLEGVQNLTEGGVYLYSSEVRQGVSSQTFVGLATGERSVDLEVDLTFKVVDPTVSVTNTESSTTETDVYTYTTTQVNEIEETKVERQVITFDVSVQTTETSWQSNWYNSYEYLDEDDEDDNDDETQEDDDDVEDDDVEDDDVDDTDDTDDTDDVEDDDVEDDDVEENDDTDDTDDVEENDDDSDKEEKNSEEEILEENTDSEQDIPDEPVPLEDIPEDPVPLADIPEEDVPLVEIPEEDIPLVDLPDEPVPQTGDTSYVWYFMVLLAGAALLCLNSKDKKENEQA